MAGFIKLHRGWRNNPVFQDAGIFSEPEAWVWLLENATWKDTVRRTGQGAVMPLERGQLHVSLGSLSAAWGWSIKRVRGFLARLEKGSMVGTASDKRGTILTISNYSKYQDDTRTQGTPEGTDGAQLGHTQEEGKERKEEKNKGGYAFSGRVIRLTAADLARWSSAFNLLDLPALLQSRDDWFVSQSQDIQRRWFNSTSNWLAKQQQAASAESRVTSQIGVGI